MKLKTIKYNIFLLVCRVFGFKSVIAAQKINMSGLDFLAHKNDFIYAQPKSFSGSHIRVIEDAICSGIDFGNSRVFFDGYQISTKNGKS